MNKAFIDKIVKREVAQLNLFLVECKMSTDHKITVYVDGIKGISIDECARLSKRIKQQLDHHIEDFELEVSSAGIGRPFKVLQQYLKSVGSKIAVVTRQGIKYRGKLLNANEHLIEIEIEKKEKTKGKRKQTSLIKKEIAFEDIKMTKEVINF